MIILSIFWYQLLCKSASPAYLNLSPSGRIKSRHSVSPPPYHCHPPANLALTPPIFIPTCEVALSQLSLLSHRCPRNTSRVRIINCFGKSLPSSPYRMILPPHRVPSCWPSTLRLFILLRVLMTLVRSDVISPHKMFWIPTIRYGYYDWLKILMDFSFHFSLWPPSEIDPGCNIRSSTWRY